MDGVRKRWVRMEEGRGSGVGGVGQVEGGGGEVTVPQQRDSLLLTLGSQSVNR